MIEFDKQSPAFKHGWADADLARMGRTVKTNPYQFPSRAYAEWQQGYNSNPGKLLPPSKRLKSKAKGA
jgi:hypothetical protein